MAEDISKQTVVILAVLTVVISVLSTVLVFSSVSDDSTVYVRSGNAGNTVGIGKVHLKLQNTNPVEATGQVILNIEN